MLKQHTACRTVSSSCSGTSTAPKRNQVETATHVSNCGTEPVVDDVSELWKGGPDFDLGVAGARVAGRFQCSLYGLDAHVLAYEGVSVCLYMSRNFESVQCPPWFVIWAIALGRPCMPTKFAAHYCVLCLGYITATHMHIVSIRIVRHARL